MPDTGVRELPDEAMVDLLVKQVTEGLSLAEQRALDLLGASAVEHLRDFERAAAAITLAGTPVVESPPAVLRARLEAAGLAQFAALGESSFAVGAAATAPAVATLPTAAGSNVINFDAAERRAAAATDASRRGSRGGTLGWLAAAACLVLALFSWFRPPTQVVSPMADVDLPGQRAVVAPPAPEPAVPPTPAEERVALLARADSIKVTLGATKDPAARGVTGDAVWDPVTQKGFLHFVGLATNDPQVQQYQIWIFDGKRDKRYPVDGGVFDVPADAAEVVIPIHAALSISLAKAFAVTVEKPGGVVVSALGHVVVLGAAG